MYTLCLVLFVFCAFLIAYVYALYPLAIVLIGLCRREGRAALLDDEALPSVEMLVPAFNEEKVIAQKLDTTLAADYPAAKLTCTVISDCSTDDTDTIVQRYEERGIRFVRNTEQKGKMTTLSEFASASEADIVLITDANAIFAPHALRALMRLRVWLNSTADTPPVAWRRAMVIRTNWSMRWPIHCWSSSV